MISPPLKISAVEWPRWFFGLQLILIGGAGVAFSWLGFLSLEDVLHRELTLVFSALVRGLLAFVVLPSIAARLSEIAIARRRGAVDIEIACARQWPWPLGGGIIFSSRAVFRVCENRKPAVRRIVLFAYRQLVFPAVVAVMLFSLQQDIEYGGFFGQYRREGFGPWFSSYAAFAGTAIVSLGMYALLLRASIATVALAFRPFFDRAVHVRRITAAARFILYDVAVPVLVASQINY